MYAMPENPLDLMADSVNAAALPAGLHAYAGYVDGDWPSFRAICERFAGKAHCISITTRGGNARIADVEAGDMSPASGARWLADRVPQVHGGNWTQQFGSRHNIAPQWRPGLYLPESFLLATLRELKLLARPLDRSAYVLWIARWQAQVPTRLPAGWDAWQFLNDKDANVDYSVFGPSFVKGPMELQESC